MFTHEDVLGIRAFLYTPIKDTGLSVRSMHCLENLDIHTVYDLVRTDETTLTGSRNLGRKSINEIKDLLAEYNLSLGMTDLSYVESGALPIEEKAADALVQILDEHEKIVFNSMLTRFQLKMEETKTVLDELNCFVRRIKQDKLRPEMNPLKFDMLRDEEVFGPVYVIAARDENLMNGKICYIGSHLPSPDEIERKTAYVDRNGRYFPVRTSFLLDPCSTHIRKYWNKKEAYGALNKYRAKAKKTGSGIQLAAVPLFVHVQYVIVPMTEEQKCIQDEKFTLSRSDRERIERRGFAGHIPSEHNAECFDDDYSTRFLCSSTSSIMLYHQEDEIGYFSEGMTMRNPLSNLTRRVSCSLSKELGAYNILSLKTPLDLHRDSLSEISESYVKRKIESTWTEYTADPSKDTYHEICMMYSATPAMVSETYHVLIGDKTAFSDNTDTEASDN